MVLSDRQKDSEFSARADYAVNLDAASVCFNNQLAMKQSYTQTLFLGCLEWPEQRLFDKFLRHSTSVIAHCEAQRVPFVNRDYLNQTLSIDGFVCIDDQIGQNLVN